jgi:DNA-binding CsgD family transcriptional regulator
VIFDAREARKLEAAERALGRLPAGALPVALIDAIRPCAPAAAGILGVIRPRAPDKLVSHPVRLPPDVFDGWLRTPRDVLARTLGPLILAPAGGLRRDADVITGALRERLTVLRQLSAAGLGEGAGYKIMKRSAPWQGAAHYMLALIAERGEALPPRAEALLRALNPAVREAVLRLGLPLAARDPLLAQIVEEQSLGYLCVALGGAVLEANRRAHQLVMRYRAAAGIGGRRRALAEFAERARDRARRGRPWWLAAASPPALLEVNAHRMARGTHALREDVILLLLKESFPPGSGAAGPDGLGELTSRQREIALLMVHAGLSYKQIAVRLDLSVATVRTHVEHVYRALGVHSRAELSARLSRG